MHRLIRLVVGTAGISILLLSGCSADRSTTGQSSPTGGAGGGAGATTSASVVFVSATPQVVSVRASGGVESSLVVFQVRDASGNPVTAGQTVNFTMSGPGGGRQPSAGGEYIGTDDGTPTQQTAATVANGTASIRLNAGTVSGPVTITATVSTPTGSVSSTSSTISIGGGVASASHFNIASSRLNLQGRVTSGVQATISAYIADRFGNFNVLQGTTVSFYTEAGGIDTSNITDATGLTTVVFRTQAPMPNDIAISPAEITMINNLNSAYGTTFPTTGSVHPSDGHLTVLATVAGEETFIDANGNGLYDVGEARTDIGEPFIDADDNGTFDSSEFYVDTNGNGTYDGPNGVWDGPSCPEAGCITQKTIWTSMNLAFTGNITNCYLALTPTPGSTYTISASGSQQFRFMLGDTDLNAPLAGTTISVTTSKGALVGTTNYTVPDAVGGPVEIFFTLLDPDSDATVDSSSVTVQVTPANGITACPSITMTGTVQ